MYWMFVLIVLFWLILKIFIVLRLLIQPQKCFVDFYEISQCRRYSTLQVQMLSGFNDHKPKKVPYCQHATAVNPTFFLSLLTSMVERFGTVKTRLALWAPSTCVKCKQRASEWEFTAARRDMKYTFLFCLFVVVARKFHSERIWFAIFTMGIDISSDFVLVMDKTSLGGVMNSSVQGGGETLSIVVVFQRLQSDTDMAQVFTVGPPAWYPHCCSVLNAPVGSLWDRVAAVSGLQPANPFISPAHPGILSLSGWKEIPLAITNRKLPH